MSIASEHALAEQETKPFRDYLKQLIENDELSHYSINVAGICQKFLDEYPNQLSEKQMYWIGKVENDFKPQDCSQCERPRDWQDALDDGLLNGLCSGCYHDNQRRV